MRSPESEQREQRLRRVLRRVNPGPSAAESWNNAPITLSDRPDSKPVGSDSHAPIEASFAATASYCFARSMTSSGEGLPPSASTIASFRDLYCSITASTLPAAPAVRTQATNGPLTVVAKPAAC